MNTEKRQSGSLENTLHHAMRPFFLLSRLFGVLPASGLWSSTDVAHVHFTWCSVVVLISFVLMGFAFIDFVLSAKLVVGSGFRIYTVGPLSFSIICLCGYVCFFLLARNWPNLIKQTRRCEVIFLRKCYESLASKRFTYNIRAYGAILFCGAVVEHLLYISNAAYTNYLQIQECNFTVNFLENYFIRESSQIFLLIAYKPWLIPLIEWITFAMTFTWNFIDIFLTLVCGSLAMRFNQFHWRIERHTNEPMPRGFWQEMRRDFLSLTDVLWLYDEKLSNLVLLACAHNLYFICVQIFHSFHDKGNFMTEIYFWLSIVYVLIRILAMMFAAASIPDAADKITVALYEIPTAYWCSELTRLNEVVVSDLIAISGKGLFFLTRRLIFAMAGTIIIYELVLINQVRDYQMNIDFCAFNRKLFY